VPEQDAIIVSTRRLVKSFDVSRTQIERLQEVGMPKVDTGKWDLEVCWRWRYDRLKSQQDSQKPDDADIDKDTEDALLKRRMRELKEIELAKLRGEILESKPVLAIIERAVSAFKTRMLSIPTKSAGRLVGLEVNEARGVLESDIHTALTELSRIGDDLEALQASMGEILLHGNASSEADAQSVGRQKQVSVSRGKRRARKVGNRKGRVSTRDHGRDKRAAHPGGDGGSVKSGGKDGT